MQRWSGLLKSRKVSAGPVIGIPRDAQSAGIPSPGLHAQEIVLDVDANDSATVLALAAAYIGRGHGLDPAPILRALQRREEAGSTALGYGVAIPHARIAGIGRPLTLFLRTRYPVAFGAPDDSLVSNFFVIMVPVDGDTDQHLELLANVATCFGERAFRAQLAMATTANQVDDAFSGRVAGVPLRPSNRIPT